MKPVIFSIPQYQQFAQELAQLLDADLGEVERRCFPDGEQYQRLLSEVYERHVILVGGTISDNATLSLYDLACACVKYGARRLDLCIPYFGYSTMERAVLEGEVVTAKTRARLFSMVPPASYGNYIHLLDLHSEGITHYFESGVRTKHLSARPLIFEYVCQINQGDFVLASTDTGRAKWVESFANELGVDAAVMVKRRLSGDQTEVIGLNAQVQGKVVVIYDDMVRTGGSLIKAAQSYLDAGATEIHAICTHGVFPAEAWTRVQQSRVFKSVVATDSHPNVEKLIPKGLSVLKTASLFAKSLQYSII
jgi:ribose-phosphate pyrophosphokinase